MPCPPNGRLVANRRLWEAQLRIEGSELPVLGAAFADDRREVKNKTKGTYAAALALVAVLAGGVIPAAATEAPPPSAVATNTDVSPKCVSGWRYQALQRTSSSLVKIGPTHSSRNGTGSSASMTLTSTVSGTVGAAWTGSTNVSGSVKLASISGTFGINAQASVTATVGNSITITVPAGKTGNGDYGIWKTYVTGKEVYYLNNCTSGASSATNVWAPYRVGWNTWIS